MTILLEQYNYLKAKSNEKPLVSVEDIKAIMSQVKTMHSTFYMVAYEDFVKLINSAYNINTRMLHEGSDFWMHMVEHEFALVSSGSIREMNKEFGEKLWDEYDEPMERPIEEEIFQVVRNIFFKELEQLPEFKGNKKIAFYIVW